MDAKEDDDLVAALEQYEEQQHLVQAPVSDYGMSECEPVVVVTVIVYIDLVNYIYRFYTFR